MRVLLAVDRSPCSESAVEEVSRHQWPADTEFEVVSVAHTRVPVIPDPTFFLLALHESALDEAREEAAAHLKRTQTFLAASLPASRVSTAVLDGRTAKAIVDEAARWHADLIVVGSHGRSRLGALLHRSVSRAVSRRAPCAVDVVGASH